MLSAVLHRHCCQPGAETVGLVPPQHFADKIILTNTDKETKKKQQPPLIYKNTYKTITHRVREKNNCMTSSSQIVKTLYFNRQPASLCESGPKQFDATLDNLDISTCLTLIRYYLFASTFATPLCGRWR